MNPYDALGALGPYFALEPTDDVDAGWRPLRDLLEPGPLDGRVAFTARFLGGLAGADVEERVAASTASLGLFARVLSPVLGASALGASALGVPLPALTLDSLAWRTFETGPWPLAVTRRVGEASVASVLEDVVAPLVDRFAEGFALSSTVLWGNAASALFGAVAALRTVRPDLVPVAEAQAVDALSVAPLAGTGDVGAGGFVRRSCCLYYRIPGGGYCGDCVLAHPRTVR